MVVDTSALVAILLHEPEAAVLMAALAAADPLCLAAPNWLEAMLVISTRLGPAGVDQLVALIDVADIAVEPADAQLAEQAFAAWRAYGKGRHPAALNFGDCFAYALAVQRGEPLLFKGGDFSQTDVLSAL